MGSAEMNNSKTSNPTSPNYNQFKQTRFPFKFSQSNSTSRICQLLHFNNKKDNHTMTTPTGKTTSIRVSYDTKNKLDHLALHRKETYDNILVRILEKQ